MKPNSSPTNMKGEPANPGLKGGISYNLDGASLLVHDKMTFPQEVVGGYIDSLIEEAQPDL